MGENVLHCRWCPYWCGLWRGKRPSGWSKLLGHIIDKHWDKIPSTNAPDFEEWVERIVKGA